jgi:hypothetical protein
MESQELGYQVVREALAADPVESQTKKPKE